MDWTGCAVVESVPGKMSGVPVLRHTRLPADWLLRDFDEGMTIAELDEAFGLDQNDLREMLQFAGRVVNVPVTVAS